MARHRIVVRTLLIRANIYCHKETIPSMETATAEEAAVVATNRSDSVVIEDALLIHAQVWRTIQELEQEAAQSALSNISAGTEDTSQDDGDDSVSIISLHLFSELEEEDQNRNPLRDTSIDADWTLPFNPTSNSFPGHVTVCDSLDGSISPFFEDWDTTRDEAQLATVMIPEHHRLDEFCSNFESLQFLKEEFVEIGKVMLENSQEYRFLVHVDTQDVYAVRVW